jgi:hypothetical protein
MNEIIYWTSGEGNNDVLNFVQHASILAICKFHVHGWGAKVDDNEECKRVFA